MGTNEQHKEFPHHNETETKGKTKRVNTLIRMICFILFEHVLTPLKEARKTT